MHYIIYGFSPITNEPMQSYITQISFFSPRQLLNGTKSYLRPLSSAVVCQSQALVAQNTKPVALLPAVRSFQTSPASRDIDSAAKFIGAGAATVGVAGSGEFKWS